MGRELKRVPLNFDWPRDKIWYGYQNPYRSHRVDCEACQGKGLTPEARRISDQWYGYVPFDPVAYGAEPLRLDNPTLIAVATRNVSRSPSFYGSGEAAVYREVLRLHDHLKGQWCHHLIQADVDALVEADRLWDFTRRPRTPEQAAQVTASDGFHPNGWMKEPNGYTPTAQEINEWSLTGLAHDAINSHICLKARCEREGVQIWCSACEGAGRYWPNTLVKAYYDAWTDYDPPTGDGYQLWETTSEGSPASPVFKTLHALCRWCEDNATTFGSNKTTAAKWREMLDDNHVYHQEGHMVFL